MEMSAYDMPPPYTAAVKKAGASHSYAGQVPTEYYTAL